MNSPDISDLKRLGFRPAGGGAWARPSFEAVAEKIQSADLVASDVDECIFPFIGQAEAGASVLRHVIEGVKSFEDARLAARMSLLAAGLMIEKYHQKLTGRIQNSLLIKKFEDFLAGAPMDVVNRSSAELVLRYYSGAPETFALFTERGVKVGMISLGVDFFTKKFTAHLKEEYGVGAAFAECTWTLERNGRFAGYDSRNTLLAPEDKGRLLRMRIEEFGAKRPLVIGHDRDDVGMFEAAREAGGAALGFNPLPAVCRELDAAVFGGDWKPVAAFLRSALDRGGKEK